MAGLLDDWRKSQYLQMAEEKLQGLLNIPTEAQRFITNPQAFMGLLGRNELPRETGFAAGVTGLPPKNVEPGGVLNPKAEPYTKGYEQGEPLSYAAMALPMAVPVGKALAPKAYNMLEDYMVKTGGIIPLEAWHGTPHNIQGKFDINKVGTGEGAQAYGHGMYFAENPEVAKGYKNAITQKNNEAIKYSGQTTKEIDDALKELSYFYKNAEKVDLSNKQELAKFVKNAAKLSEEEGATDIAKTLKSLDVNKLQENTGNLYKVDIPDEYIPNMLDYEKVVDISNPAIKDAAKVVYDFRKSQGNARANAPFEEFAKKEFGKNSNLYDDLSLALGGQEKASEFLAERGIPGIKYLDEGSRNKGKGTYNYVVFDPSTVKILEKNKKKVGLLD